MNSGGFDSPSFVVRIEHTVAGAFDQLAAEDVAEQIIVRRFVASVFQEFGQDVYHCSVQWDN